MELEPYNEFNSGIELREINLTSFVDTGNKETQSNSYFPSSYNYQSDPQNLNINQTLNFSQTSLYNNNNNININSNNININNNNNINNYNNNNNNFTNNCNSNLNLTNLNISNIRHSPTNSSFYSINSTFSQNDMSFLSNTKSITHKIKEDEFKLNKNDPEIVGELKEKIYFTIMDNKIQRNNIISKGYIGILTKKNFLIKNKEFFLNFSNKNWSDNKLYENKNIEKSLQRITELTYKIQIINKSSSIKFLTYSINSDVLFNTKLINPNFSFDNKNSIININILYNNVNINSKIYKIVVTLFECKGNIIGTDGILNKINNNTFSVTYNNGVKNSKIIYSNNNFDFKKINVRFELKEIFSDNKIRISYNNNNKNNNNVESEDLNIEKLALISFDYLM